MNDNPSPPKGLQQLHWKLTISYAAVTVGALLTVELLLFGALAGFLISMLNGGGLQTQLIESASSSYTPVLRFLLTQEPPDQAALAEWMDNLNSATLPSLPLSFDATDNLFVVDQNGRFLAATPPDFLGDNQIGQLLNTQAMPELDGVVQSALAGEGVEKLYTTARPGENIIMAIPIWDTKETEIVGVLVAIATTPTFVSLFGEALPILGVSLLFFTIIAALIGTVYGFLAARQPVERLNRLSEASIAWSQGDFTNMVKDSAPDELGQLTHRLNKMAQQLDLLLETRHELAVVEERNRLARDLHDSVKQQAFAAAAQISGVRTLMQRDPKAAEAHLSEAEKLIYDLRQELTTLILDLRPAALEGKGLAATVRDYATNWSRQSNIMSDVRVQNVQALPLTIEQTLFRIAQEALSNVARHSQAEQVDIALIYTSDKIALTIVDNGCGFDIDNRSRGYGVNSMKERAASLGGMVTIESVLNKGTAVSCTIPAKENSHE